MLFRSMLMLSLTLAGVGVLRAEQAVKFAPLPQKISSFGACVLDGYIYVYGGHTGKTHTYSTDTTTGQFLRASLEGGEWETLPAGPSLQGLALVAHKGKLYRIGGMQPRNKPGDKHDNHSQASFAVYDPATRKWQDLVDLPEGRSSHEAVVVGDRLHVLGGWKMNGEGKESTWHRTGLVMDLSKSPLKWESIDQPFERRALGMAAVGERIFVLGGLSPKAASSTRVDILDTKTGKWSQGTDVPRRSTHMGTGFSPAACVLDGRLYISTNDGRIHRLAEDGQKWQEVAEQSVKRFVPQLLPGKKGTLIVVGGSVGMTSKSDPKPVEVIRADQ